MIADFCLLGLECFLELLVVRRGTRVPLEYLDPGGELPEDFCNMFDKGFWGASAKIEFFEASFVYSRLEFLVLVENLCEGGNT